MSNYTEICNKILFGVMFMLKYYNQQDYSHEKIL